MKIVRIGRSLAAAALAVSLLGAAGCSDDDPEADGDPTTSALPSTESPSPSPSESSTPDEPTPPEWPDAADGTGDKAARAFAKYWLKMLDYAQQTGDAEQLVALHAVTCETCAAGVEGIKKGTAQGGYVRGGNHEISSIHSVDSGDPEVRIVGLVTKRTRSKQFDQSGRVKGVVKSGISAYRLYLRREHETWVVGALEVRM